MEQIQGRCEQDPSKMLPDTHARYRPAVLAVTGLAAAYSVYLLYSALSRPDKPGLHRRNAIHRSRRGRRPPVEFHIYEPTAEAPLGTLVVGRSQNQFFANLVNGFPSLDAIESALGPAPEDVYFQAQCAAVYSIILMATTSETTHSQPLVNSTPLASLVELREALWARRDDAAYTEIRDFLVANLPSIVPRAIESGIATYMGDPTAPPDGDPGSESDTHSHIAETEAIDRNVEPPGPGHELNGLLYYIAEEDAKNTAYRHRGITCDGCGQTPIQGVRWRCLNCYDFDLCSACEAEDRDHRGGITHVFAKIKIPIPKLSQPSQRVPVWYSGDPTMIAHLGPLDPATVRYVTQRYGLDEPAVRALYEQFCSTVDTVWPEDPANIKAAISRTAFNLALTPDRWHQRHIPNLVYDRAFAFYDTDANGMIGFYEFVGGIEYLLGNHRFRPLDRALAGFDIDGDGFVDRADFLRMLRANYTIHQMLVRDMVNGLEDEQAAEALDIVIGSSKPISSAFRDQDIPRGQARQLRGKQRNGFGDMQPLSELGPILGRSHPWPIEDRPSLQNVRPRAVASRERLQSHLSRFEELLRDPAPRDAFTSQAGGDADQAHENGPFSPEASSMRDDLEPGTQEQLGLPPNVEDVLWQVVEDAFDQLLDKIFLSVERTSREAVETRAERERWRSEIDAVFEEQQALQRELHAAAATDPLMASAMHLSGLRAGSVVRKVDGSQLANLRAEMVPTDSESLTRRESEIAKKPLDELLAESGYGTVDDVDGSTGLQTSGHEEPATTGTRAAPSEQMEGTSSLFDPTMPQHRPNSPPAEFAIETTPAAEARNDSRISRERLEYLLTLDSVDAEIKSRGGPGRASLQELEAMVEADSTRELYGIVTSWLELASF